MRGGFTESGGTAQTGGVLTVSGSGDIAPAVAGAAGLGTTVTQTLVGTFLALIAVTVVATLFITAEYRRGLIHTTLSATPRRGGVLVAKAAVVGAVAFSTGLVAAAVVVTLGQRVLREHGVYLHPATVATQARLVAGTAALLALAAVLALAIGALLRRSAAAVASVVVLIVLPYLLTISVLPTAAAQWLLRISPAAAFAIQQSAVRYPQVDNLYTPASGCFPLPPWAGLGVPVGWAALSMGLCRGRDPAEGRVSAARPSLAGPGRALRAEWTKLRTTPGPAWLLLGFVVATVATGLSVQATTDPSRLVVGPWAGLGVLAAWAAAALLAGGLLPHRRDA